MEKNEVIYLDDEHNVVDKEIATKAVIRILDADGNLISEAWSYLKEQPEVQMPEGEEVKVVYVDSDGKEVSEEEAVSVIFKTFKDGELVSEESFDLAGESNKLL